jgi:putative NADPH-quinone reductase
VQPLEADLLAAQEAILWAEHLVFAYPIWWGGAPALLKGFVDRAFLPGFAFKYRPGKAFPEQLRRPHGPAAGDDGYTAWYFRWVYRMPGIHQLRRTTLEFCGVKPVRVASFGPILGSTAPQRARWLAQAQHAGAP